MNNLGKSEKSTRICIITISVISKNNKTTTTSILKELIPAIFSSFKLFKMLLLLTILVLFFLVNCSETYHVNSSSDLEKYLCDKTWSSQQFVLSLNSSVNFTLSSGTFCQMTSNQTSNIDIRSDSLTEWAIITCIYNDSSNIRPQSRRGLAFFNTTVTLERLIFKDCGTYLTTIQDSTITDYLNSSSLYYSSSHAAVLVFVHCQVNITQVNIYYSFGFAMIGVNLIDSTIRGVNISNSSLSTNLYRHTEHKRRTIGCGALLHFFDHPLMMYPTYVNVNYVRFKNNFDLHKAYPYITEVSSISSNIVNAAGLTVLYIQKAYFASVTISNTEFTSNVGSYSSPGGLLVLHYKSSLNTSTIVNNSLFSDNANGPKSLLHGAALVLYWIKVIDLSMTQPQLLLIQNTKFYNHTGHGHNYLPTTAIYVAVAELEKTVKIDIHFINCSFQNNLAQETGACLFMSVYDNAKKFANMSVVLESIHATNNSQKLSYKPVSTAGIFSFSNVGNVSITGTSTFTNNYGSVIDALNSDVYLSKNANVTFSNNVGSSGAAIRLLGNGYLYFIGGAVVNFTNNRAQEFGGAIYASSGIRNSFSLKVQCIIKLIDFTKEKNISFTENLAIYAGNSIYAYPLFSCKLKENISNNASYLEFYRNHFHFIEDKKTNKLHNISTSASKLTLCYSNGTHRNSIESLNTYPGQKIKIYMASIDAVNRSVYSDVAVTIAKNRNILELHKKQKQILCEGNNCTSFKLKIYSKEPNTTEGKLVFSLPGFPDALVVNVTVQHCPLGFVWHNKTQKCVCSSAFYNEDFYLAYGYKADCDIDYLSMARPILSANTWAGYMNASTGFGVSFQCPLGYCDDNGAFFCSSTNNMAISTSKTCDKGTLQSLCLHCREGPLCGSCSRLNEVQKLSVVFGSTECKQCSNWWLLTLVLYAIAGPLLVFLLYALRLTLTTGTLIGIIFYAHIANCGIIDLLSLKLHQEPYSKFCLIFLSILNLNLGFPLCFYNGMTELWKVGLSLIFPFYLLTIVVVLIILSHFSVRLSNRIPHSSVQVLVTVIHLSFSKLLLATIDVFTSARIYYDSDSSSKVWFWDGSIEYGSGSHLILMIITLIIVISLLLPYVLVLIFARPIRRTRINKYIRPLLEAIHAPYKEGKEYWFVAQLVFLVGICVMYASMRARNILKIYIIIAPLLFLLLLLHVYFKPYKNKVINLLDCWLMLNIVMIYTTTWFFFIESNYQAIAVFVSVMVFMVFLTFLVILLYHILLVTGKISSITTIFHLMQHSYKQKVLSYKPLLSANDSFYNSCEYKESLLSSSN